MAGEKTLGFQWERYEAWRHHPLLRVNFKTMWPGFTVGFAAFMGYVIYDKSTPKEEHH